MTESKTANAMWGGRFGGGPSEIMEKINASIDFDKRLYKQDIAGSRAHCKMLAKQGIISEADRDAILAGLDQVEQEIESGAFKFSKVLEDIHMNVESRLTEIVGKPAGRLHTARSRNDQVATDFKIYVRDTLQHMDSSLAALQEALLDQAEAHAETILPGCTHLQAAQPVTFGHHLMAYVEMFDRDRSRARDAFKRAGDLPLGAAALAGTSFPIDRHFTASELGFDGPTRNSIDSVSDRDFAMEFLSAAAICAVHLSRLAEEIVIWATAQYRFINLPDSYSTGSSIMPQKRNPDAAELIRAKAGRVIGNLNSLMVVMKGLPLAYSKDMQDDKEPVFEAADTLFLSIAAMAGMMAELTVNADQMRKYAGAGFTTATDLADYCVRVLNIPFREAHHISGSAVKMAEDRGCELDDLSLEDYQSIEPGITEEIFGLLTVEDSVRSRTSFGGTAPNRVREAVTEARKRCLDQ